MDANQCNFEEVQHAFFQFTCSQKVPMEELENDSIFFQSSEIQNLIGYGARNNEYLDKIVQGFSCIEKMDIYRGCLTGYLIGLYGENKIVRDETDQALGGFYLKILSLCCRYLTLACEMQNVTLEALNEGEDCEPEEVLNDEVHSSILLQEPDTAKAWAGIYMLTMGLMSRMAQSRRLRDQMRKSNALNLCCKVQDYCGGVGFVPCILNMVEHETVLLLAPDLELGVEAELEQIDSNNVFFTLLQFAMYHKGLLEKMGAENFDYDEVIERLALHKPVEENEYPSPLYQEGCFGFYTYPARNSNGEYDQMRAVWGEGTLQEVPKLEGRYVILLTKPIIHRSWSNAFVTSSHPGLRPHVKILRELPKEEVRDWLKKSENANFHTK